MSKKYINFETDNNIGLYFKDVRKSNNSVMLTPQEEVTLGDRIKQGDVEAINKLVKANLKFVISIAKDYQGQGLPLSDLISEGNYGLIKAALKFDNTRGFKFISYAVWWVRQAIIQSINDNGRMVRLPTNIINKLAYVNKEIIKFNHLNERDPIFGEITDKNNDNVDLIFFPKCVSLNDSVNEDGDELIHLISDEDEENDEIVDYRVKNELNNILSMLTERERDIIECYYGLNPDYECMTLEAIGEKYNLTKERIRQIKAKTLRKLKNESQGLWNILKK